MPELTPAQREKLDEIEHEYADWMRRKQGERSQPVNHDEPPPQRS